MTSDGRWNYAWDAENRLLRVQSRSDTPQGSWRRVEWQYDALGRRIRQTTSNWLVQSNLWAVTEDLKFLSHPLLFARHVVDLNASNNVAVRTYVWGLDLSETMDGAGGVGGLLWVTLHTGSGPAAGTHFAAYDGNGNVVALSAASDGSETARYEYGPFGEPLRLTGPAATNNPFRFSTKRTEPAADLVLYEYRAYSPRLSRWPNRDPIGELGFQLLRTGRQIFLSSSDTAPPTAGGVREAAFELIQELGLVDADAVNEFLGGLGGLNLYCLIGNDLLNFTDYLGLAPFCVCIRADDDHAWIWVKDLATGEVHTYGRWKKGYGRPAANKSGVIVDMEKNRRYGASRCIQVQEFKPTINEGYNVYNNNCATYAWSEWKRVSGEDLKKSSLFGSFTFDHPSVLRDSINKANAVKKSEGCCGEATK